MTKQRPKILVVVDYYLPAFKAGGPLQSIRGLVQQFGKEAKFYVICYDRDLGDEVPYSLGATGKWRNQGGAAVLYLRQRRLNLVALALVYKRLRPHSVYLNSYFSWLSIQILMLRRFGILGTNQRIIVAPRGELAEGALKLKWRKKSIYRLISGGIFDLYGGVVWHASTSIERDEILRASSSTAGSVIVARNIVVAPDIVPFSYPKLYAEHSRVKSAGEAKMVFLSRLSPKKNIHFIFPYITKLRGSVLLDVIGPAESDYLEYCQNEVRRLGGDEWIRFLGPVRHSEVYATYLRYHYFVLPTLNENFGHAIVEALACGLPVILSNNTPWRDVEKFGVGWSLDLRDTLGWDRVIKTCIDADQVEYSLSSARAMSFGRESSVPDLARNREVLFGC